MAMTTNKRGLPASLTYNGKMISLKRECCVADSLSNMHIYADENGSPKEQEEKESNKNIPLVQQLVAEGAGKAAPSVQSRKVSNKDFKRLIVLGTGSFAKVILVKSNFDAGTSDNLFAMKVLDKKLIVEKNQTSHTMTERSILGRCSSGHPFIVSLKYAFQTERTLNLVIDFCSGGELFYHLSRVGRFPESRAQFYVAELTLALEFLHVHNVVYRDLKPENVLIANDGHIKLADFGLAKEEVRHCTEGTDTFCGTPEYLAPEILYRTGHGKSVDWWSLGILLYEMLYRLPPWYNKNRRKMFEGICSGALVFPKSKEGREYASPACQNLIQALLTKSAKERLGSRGTEQIKQHAFFNDIDFERVLNKDCEVPWKPEQGKIYFDQEVTQLPFDTPCDSPRAANAPAYFASSYGQGNVVAASPLYASSFVERAFSGFSFTDPTLVSLNDVSAPSPTASFSNKAKAAGCANSSSSSSKGINLPPKEGEEDELDDCKENGEYYDEGGQFDLELEH